MPSGSPGVVPGCSGANTVNCSASPSRNGSHCSPPAPCRNTTGSPEPARCTRVVIWPSQNSKVSVVTICSRSHRLALVAQTLGPPAVLPLGEVVAQMREHLRGEQVDVLEGELVGHRADVQEHHQVPHAQLLDRV